MAHTYFLDSLLVWPEAALELPVLRTKQGSDCCQLLGKDAARSVLTAIPVTCHAQELTLDRIAAEADLNRTLGTLRYLTGLRAARATNLQSPPTSPRSPRAPQEASSPSGSPSAARSSPSSTQLQAAGVKAAPADDPSPPVIQQQHIASSSADAPSQAEALEEDDAVKQEAAKCPVCHEVMAVELMMLTCGHQLCCRCCMTLIERLPAFPPQVAAAMLPVCNTQTA